MKKIIIVIFILLFPTIVNAETIYNSILRDNEVKPLPTTYNIFGCVPENSTPEHNGTCIIGEGENADYVVGYTNELVGLYPYEDDKGKVYFFRGWPNNWVRLGTYNDTYYYYFVDSINNFKVGTLSSCQNEASDPSTYCIDKYKIGEKNDPIYWRIIRTNGDKSVRLVYSGTKIDDYVDKIVIGASAFNTKQDELKYSGYTYKENNQVKDSALKAYIDNWYNLTKSTYQKYIVPSTFINDTSEIYQNCYGTKATDLCFPAYTRLWYWSETNSFDIKPTLKKSNSTKDYGGDYTLEVGTYTGDEIIMAGGSMWGYAPVTTLDPKSNHDSPDKSTYDSKIWVDNYWTMTPGDSSISRATGTEDPYAQHNKRQVEVVASNGCSFTEDVTRYFLVRPVISIDGNINMAGNGTEEDPYHLEEQARVELTLGNNSKQLSSYIEDLPDNLEWIIDNPEILSIKNNIIVPKKIGETKIHTTKDGVTYTINVKITNLVNPKTVTETLIIVILVTYLLLGTTILKKKKTRIN